MKNFYVLFFCCFFALLVNAQENYFGKETSDYSYIFQISNQQAKSLHEKVLHRLDEPFFERLIDSFPTRSEYTKKLSQGHYIQSTVNKSIQENSYLSIQDFEVFVMNNAEDLLIQVYLPNGKKVDNAVVRVNNRKLSFNSKTASYTDRNSNKNGLLSVTHNNHTAFYQLSRARNASPWTNIPQKLAYSYPTKYLWMPIEFVAMLPVDGVKSIRYGYPVNRINKTVNAWHWVTCLFDSYGYYCDDYNEKKYDVAYFALNKPKFKPSDTLKGKVFVFDDKSKPLKENLSLKLYEGYSLKKTFKNITAYRPGAYTFEIVLHDSLDLKLDKNYNVRLYTDESDQVASTYFIYEEYVLKNNTINVSTEKNMFYTGETVEVSINAFDANQNRLKDATGNLVMLKKNYKPTTSNYVFVADTLWKKKIELHTNKPTKISLPDSIFPLGDLEYDIKISVSDASGEINNKKLILQHVSSKEVIHHKTIGDSIFVEFKKLGKPTSANLIVETADFFGNKDIVEETTTPFTFAIDPFVDTYLLSMGDLHKEIKVKDLLSRINASLYTRKDAVHIEVANSNQLYFYYAIYKGNKKIEEGFDQNLAKKLPKLKTKDYHLNLNYLWGGRIIERNYTLPNNSKDIKVEVNQPLIVYPGQEVEIEVSLTDANNRAVANADVLAFGRNAKFNKDVAPVRRLSPSPKQRKFRNSFAINQSSEVSIDQSLDIDFWDGLDQLLEKEYYQFSFPKNDLYRKELQLKDAPTQFAPFVVENGKIVPIHIIYVDKVPVYFSSTTNIQPYSFEVSEKPVLVELRTIDKLITIDSIQFTQAHKTIFSVDVKAQNNFVTVQKMPFAGDEDEKKRLLKYIMPYQLNHKGISYIKNNNRLHLLNTSKKRYNSLDYVGPILHKKVEFKKNNGYELNFDFENNYSYKFKENHLIQTSNLNKSNFYFFNNNKIPNFGDLVMSEGDIELMLELSNQKLRSNFNLIRYPQKTSRGNGSLHITHDKNLINIFIASLGKEEVTTRLYSGNTTDIYDLSPGNYRVFMIYKNDDYVLVDNVEILPNGTAYLNTENIEVRKRDFFSEGISKIILGYTSQGLISSSSERELQQNITQTYSDFETYFGESYLVTGIVTDSSNIPLPGVVIQVNNTKYGTLSDFDGYFEVRVPIENNELVFEYIGFKTQKVSVRQDDELDIQLEEDSLELNEVVTVGYTSSRSKVKTPRVNNETLELSEEDIFYIHKSEFLSLLQGQVSGLDIRSGSGQPGSSNTIVLRGVSAISDNSKPLIVVNGVPYQGDLSEISADEISSVSVLKGSSATAIYGTRATDGVIIVNTNQKEFLTDEEDEDEVADLVLPVMDSQANSLRTNFSDEAFWQPSLSTNDEGKVKFSVTYPDDITSWDTHFFVATEKQHTGQKFQNVKSFKPLMAQLFIPRFLTEGDSLYAKGRVTNYVKENIAIETSFLLNQQEVFSEKELIEESINKKLPIQVQQQDTLEATFQITRADSNYFDGESLSVPVFKKGIQQYEGGFYLLPKNKEFSLEFSEKSSEANIQIFTSLNKVFEDELTIVINYVHNCNEQMSSRLKAELFKRKMHLQTNKEINNDKEIKKLVQLLEKNQNKEELWSWWGNSTTNLWASIQVIESLLLAKDEGFAVKLNEASIRKNLEESLFLKELTLKDIQLLQLLEKLEARIDFAKYINQLLLIETMSTLDKFTLWEMLLNQGETIPWEDFFSYEKQSVLGNLYYGNNQTKSWHPYKNNVQLNLAAFRILKQKGGEEERLQQMTAYFMELREFKGFKNTFESMSVASTLMGDSFEATLPKANQLQLRKNNGIWETLKLQDTSFVMSSSEKIDLKHNADLPLFINHNQTYWERNPLANKELFEVKTFFETIVGDSLTHNLLREGEKYKMKVEVTAKQDAPYTMIEVPIPSGCEYTNKKKFYREAHRSYDKDRVYIFLQQLNEGKHSFEIELHARYEGSYTLNPTICKLMYFEEFSGNNESKTIKIE